MHQGFLRKTQWEGWWKETDFAEGGTVNYDDWRKASLTSKHAPVIIINTANINNNKVVWAQNVFSQLQNEARTTHVRSPGHTAPGMTSWTWSVDHHFHNKIQNKSRHVISGNRRVEIKNLREVHVLEWIEQQTFSWEVCRVHAVCGCWSIPVEKHSEKDQGEGHQHCWKLRDGDNSRMERC